MTPAGAGGAGAGAAPPRPEPPAEGSGGRADAAALARSLSREERLLLEVRDELYGGSWAEVEADLRARLGGKPYSFELATIVEEDLERLERMRRFEEEHGVDLAAVLRDLGGT